MSNRYKIIIAVIIVVIIGAIVAVGFFSGGNIGKFLSKGDGTTQTTETTELATTVAQSETTTAEPTALPSSETTLAESSTSAAETNPPETTIKSDGTVAAYVGTGFKRDPDTFKDIKVKALYISGATASSKTAMARIIKIANETEINALVIDIKEGGKVNYKSNVPEVVKDNAYYDYYDPVALTKLLHDNNIYVIGRLVTFRDPVLATKRPEFAIRRADGSIWKENGTTAWTNPYNEQVWRYNLDIATEAVEKGFDEIQFDYVRFPTAAKGEISYGIKPPSKSDTIAAFMKQAKTEIGDMGAVVSADVFGIILEVAASQDAIGQVLEKVVKDIDYISPMVYPSHYANKSHGTMGNGEGQSVNGVLFTAPDLKPYELIYNALSKAKSRLNAAEGHKAGVRPYLQGFTATFLPKAYYQIYGPTQIRQEIQAVYDAGYDQWIIWNSGNVYNEDAFLKEP